ncbi:DUF4232 domain-containing protein [Streptomyces sp. NPDC054854]
MIPSGRDEARLVGEDDGLGASASAKPGGSGRTPPPCTAANVSITGSFERQDSERNLFMTAVNTGDTTCALYFYPIVRFVTDTEVQPPPMESPARAAATIRPGEKAYSAVRLYREGGSRTENRTSVKVFFHDRTPNDVVGGSVSVELPQGGFVNIDSNPMVTFWNLDAAAVKSYMFKVH